MRLCAFCGFWIKESTMVLVERTEPGPGRPLVRTYALHRGACMNTYLFKHRDSKVARGPVTREVKRHGKIP